MSTVARVVYEDDQETIAVAKDDLADGLIQHVTGCESHSASLPSSYEALVTYCSDQGDSRAPLEGDITKVFSQAGVALDEDRLSWLETAITEMIQNTAEHGLGYAPDKEVNVGYHVLSTKDHAYFMVEVSGGENEFDVGKFRVIDYPAMIAAGNLRGSMDDNDRMHLGSFIMAEVFDTVFVDIYTRSQDGKKISSTWGIAAIK